MGREVGAWLPEVRLSGALVRLMPELGDGAQLLIWARESRGVQVLKYSFEWGGSRGYFHPLGFSVLRLVPFDPHCHRPGMMSFLLGIEFDNR